MPDTKYIRRWLDGHPSERDLALSAPSLLRELCDEIETIEQSKVIVEFQMQWWVGVLDDWRKVTQVTYDDESQARADLTSWSNSYPNSQFRLVRRTVRQSEWEVVKEPTDA